MKKINTDISNQIYEYASDVVPHDFTNREGHAAKVYFNNIYGNGFSRNSSHPNNIYLNYGYSILLSQFNKAITSKGYITQLGIHHKNSNNPFNLACDLMEPFRPIVDNLVFELNEDNYKEKLIDMLNMNVVIRDQNHTLVNAINIYCASIFRVLNTGDIGEIMFVQYDK